LGKNKEKKKKVFSSLTKETEKYVNDSSFIGNSAEKMQKDGS